MQVLRARTPHVFRLEWGVKSHPPACHTDFSVGGSPSTLLAVLGVLLLHGRELRSASDTRDGWSYENCYLFTCVAVDVVVMVIVVVVVLVVVLALTQVLREKGDEAMPLLSMPFVIVVAVVVVVIVVVVVVALLLPLLLSSLFWLLLLLLFRCRRDIFRLRLRGFRILPKRGQFCSTRPPV